MADSYDYGKNFVTSNLSHDHTSVSYSGGVDMSHYTTHRYTTPPVIINQVDDKTDNLDPYRPRGVEEDEW